MRSNIFWLIIHFPIVYYMVFVLELGIVGLCYSITVSCSISYIILQIDIYRCKEIKDAMFWPDRSTFQGWRKYARLAIPSASIQLTFSFIGQIGMIFAGMLGTLEQATWAQLGALTMFFVMTANGCQHAVI